MNKANSVPQIFDRKLLQVKRDRAVKYINKHSFLHKRTACELTQRLAPVDIKLPKILVWGAHTPKLCKNLALRDGTENIYWADMSFNLLNKHVYDIPSICSLVTADEEYTPFAKHSLDAIASNLTLHSVNDLKGALIQAHHSLKPDRPFVAALFGGGTLLEVKKWFMQTEIEETGGVSPRVFPFIDIRSLGDMMQNLGFIQPVIDSEIIEIEYSSLAQALTDVRGMGEGNILIQRNKAPITRALINKADKAIKQKDIKIRVEILYVIAWSFNAR